jgi:hypothetical protein
MVTITLLPYEMLTHIITFIPDKMNISIVNKLFEKVLQQMFDNGQLTDHYEPYYLKKNRHKLTIDEINNDILPSVNNYNCLNFIFTVLFTQGECDEGVYFTKALHSFNYNDGIEQNIIYLLLKRNCVMNNISRPKYIRMLMENLNKIYTGHISNILYTAITNKSYDILIILLSMPIMKGWLMRSIIGKSDDNNINEIIELLVLLRDRHVVSFIDIYSEMYYHQGTQWESKIGVEIIAYLETVIDKNIVASMYI